MEANLAKASQDLKRSQADNAASEAKIQSQIESSQLAQADQQQTLVKLVESEANAQRLQEQLEAAKAELVSTKQLLENHLADETLRQDRDLEFQQQASASNKALRSQLDAANGKVTALAADLAAAESRISTLSSQLEAALEQAAEAASRNADSVKELEATNTELEQRVKMAEDRLSARQQAEQELRGKLKQLSDANRELQALAQSASETAHFYEDAAQASDGKCRELQTQLEELTSAKARLEELQRHHETAQAELDESRAAALRDSIAQCQDLEDQVAELKTMLRGAESENNALKFSFENTESTAVSMEEKLALNEEMLDQLRRQNQELTLQLEVSKESDSESIRSDEKNASRSKSEDASVLTTSVEVADATASLTAKITALEAEKATALNARYEVEAQLHQTEQTLKALEAENDELRQRLELHEAKEERLKDVEQALDQTVAQLDQNTRLLHQAETDKLAHQQAVHRLQQANEALQTQLELALQSQDDPTASVNIDALEEANTRISELTRQLQQHEQRSQSRDMEQTKLTDIAITVTRKLVAFQDDTKERLITLGRRVLRAEEAEQRLQAMYNANSTRSLSERGQLETLQRELFACQQALTQTREDRDGVYNQHSMLKAQHDELRAEAQRVITRVVTANKELTQQLQSLNQQQVSEQVHELTSQLRDAHAQLTSQRNINVNLEARLAQSQRELSRSVGAQGLESSNRDLTSRLKLAEERNQALLGVCQQQESHMRDLVKLQNSADERHKQREHRMEALEQDLKQFHGNYMQLQSHLNRLASERDELAHQLQAQHEVNRQLQRQLDLQLTHQPPSLRHRVLEERALSITPPAPRIDSQSQMPTQSLHLPERSQLRPMAISVSQDDARALSAPPGTQHNRMLNDASTQEVARPSSAIRAADAQPERALPDKRAFLDLLRTKSKSKP
eukprot:TRINITY_DN9305_c0_g2_i1.p1 TRINITY_DN9305_c0_g2~~TRINITY_DN9305_c0_g2_i1.p1  ORF type:complete len:925 (+),score=270.50 TRINITY_DN9305_c0_g2_i1:1500-4274(+)